MRQGLDPGSTIIMTENAFMTDEAWLEMTKALCKGYRMMPYLSENPEWFFFKPLDGFGSHEQVFEALELRRAISCISGKEESHTSHANQGNDQLVAKNDKKWQQRHSHPSTK